MENLELEVAKIEVEGNPDAHKTEDIHLDCGEPNPELFLIRLRTKLTPYGLGCRGLQLLRRSRRPDHNREEHEVIAHQRLTTSSVRNLSDQVSHCGLAYMCVSRPPK